MSNARTVIEQIEVNEAATETSRNTGWVDMAVERGGYAQPALRYTETTPLDFLQNRRRITDRQWKAGVLFRASWQRAHGRSLRVANYHATSHIRGGGEAADQGGAAARSDAQAEVRNALAKLDPDTAQIVAEVCGCDEPCGPGRRGALRKARLQAGLVVLADLFAIPAHFRRAEGV